MSNRSFINRAAEEGRQCLVLGRVVAQRPVAGFVGRLQRVEHGVDRLVGIGGLALALHGVEIIHIGLIGLFIVAEQTHRSRTLLSDVLNANVYSTTFGTRKKCPWVSGAFLTMSSAFSPSVTTSARFLISIGVTDVIGSTPSTSTSLSCSTNASIAFNSSCRCGTSDFATAIRARCAIRRTVAASTDII